MKKIIYPWWDAENGPPNVATFRWFTLNSTHTLAQSWINTVFRYNNRQKSGLVTRSCDAAMPQFSTEPNAKKFTPSALISSDSIDPNSEQHEARPSDFSPSYLVLAPPLHSASDSTLPGSIPPELRPDQWIWLQAYTQSLGRGQGNKSFFSPLGGLYLSLICLWPTLPNVPPLSMLTALAVAEILDVDCTLKWVNDIFLHDKKIAGVLIDRYWDSFFSPCIISIGVNVNTNPDTISTVSPDSLPLGSNSQAITSLAQHKGCTYDMARLCERIQARLWVHYKETIALGGILSHKICDSINARLQQWGKKVQITTPLGIRVGYCCGITPTGRMILDSGQDYDVLSLCILEKKVYNNYGTPL